MKCFQQLKRSCAFKFELVSMAWRKTGECLGRLYHWPRTAAVEFAISLCLLITADWREEPETGKDPSFGCGCVPGSSLHTLAVPCPSFY